MSEVSAIFIFTTETTQPCTQVFSVTMPYPVAGCIFDVISLLNTKFFEIWSSVTGYGELCMRTCAFSQSELRKYFE